MSSSAEQAITRHGRIEVEDAYMLPGHQAGRQQLLNFAARHDAPGRLLVEGVWRHDTFVVERVAVWDAEPGWECWGEWEKIDGDGAIVDHE